MTPERFSPSDPGAVATKSPFRNSVAPASCRRVHELEDRATLVIRIGSKVVDLPSPLVKGGSREVLRSVKDLPQPLLGKEGGKKSSSLLGTGTRQGAFTLVELLVAVSLIGFLVALLLPSLSSARGRARRAVCGSNIRQIAAANDVYAMESGGVYCPGAARFLGNLHRWHGQRDALNQPFDSSRGPLVSYLGTDGAIRSCPSFEPGRSGFEAGNGGYGYNNAYIGVQTAETFAPLLPKEGSGEVNGNRSLVTTDLAGAYAARVHRPTETVMFTDTAFSDRGLIEYSFAEPRFHPQFGSRADPSIHFRHARLANVAWCDGHVSPERSTLTWSSGFYDGNPGRQNLGWFGESDDNRLFDLR